MQAQHKEPIAHWSTHPWKLSGILAIILATVSAAYVALMMLILYANPSSTAEPTYMMTWSLLPSALLAAVYVATAIVVLRAQARQSISDLARNRVTWAALPGLVVVVALLVLSFLGPRSEGLQIIYALNTLSSMLGTLLTSAPLVLLAAMLLPTMKKSNNLIVGMLVVSAVMFIPALVKQALLMALGSQATLWQWAALEPLKTLAYALVAAALVVAVHRRLWDALALQWGLLILLNTLTNLWRIHPGDRVPDWLVRIQNLSFWALPALVALYCLLMWDRGASPASPFKALGRRIGALAKQFLPT